jgi:hypothetical protein
VANPQPPDGLVSEFAPGELVPYRSEIMIAAAKATGGPGHRMGAACPAPPGDVCA